MREQLFYFLSRVDGEYRYDHVIDHNFFKVNQIFKTISALLAYCHCLKIGDDFSMNSKPIAVPFTRLQWLSLLALAAAQFINILDFMIVMPLGPRFIEELKITPEQFGHLVASYGFAAFFGGMIASGVIDRYERKRAMLVIFGCFAFCTLMCGLASEYWILLFARGMTGVFGGIVGSMTMTMVSDLFPEGRRGFALGIVAGSFAIASVPWCPAGSLCCR